MTRQEPPRLENYANNCAIAGQSPRRARYERRRLLWAESSLPRVKKCGRTLRGDHVAVRWRDGVGAGFSGLTTCGSVWVCPVCNAKIMSRRAVEIGGAVAVWQQVGLPVAFATFTMRHHKGQSLADLWQALTDAWRAITGGRGWREDCERFGIAGWVRVVEVTIGPNGWHVHTHVLLYFEVAGPDLAQLQGRMFGRWAGSLTDSGMGTPLMSGQDMHLVGGPADECLAAYFTKAMDGGRNLGLELTQTQSKTARTEHSTVPAWTLLDAVQAGEADALDAWHEWEAGSKHRRQVSWSLGFRARLGMLNDAPSDEQVAREEVGSERDDLVLITRAGWHTLLRERSLSLADVLAMTERAGLVGLTGLLDSYGAEYLVVVRDEAAA